MEFTELLSENVYKMYEKKLMSEVSKDTIPNHIAIIMDGNRRFAEAWGLSSIEGHLRGRAKLEEVLEWCLELGIKILTVYAFSTENVNRGTKEVKKLMELFGENFKRAGDDERVHKYKVKIRAIGRTDMLPKNVKASIKYAEDKTKDHDKYLFNIAIAYGGREEIIHAIKRIASEVKSGKLGLDDIREELVSSYLYTKNVPDPDLILRTSGEERISNFLLWQLAYSELYFTDVYWPGLRKLDFLRAIHSYQQRKRRFGK